MAGQTCPAQEEAAELGEGMPIGVLSRKAGQCIEKQEHSESEISQYQSRAPNSPLARLRTFVLTSLSLHFLICKVKAVQPP